MKRKMISSVVMVVFLVIFYKILSNQFFIDGTKNIGDPQSLKGTLDYYLYYIGYNFRIK